MARRGRVVSPKLGVCLAVLATSFFGGCKEKKGDVQAPRPDLTNLVSIKPDVETQMWSRLQQQIPDERLLPAVLKGDLTEAEKRQRILSFDQHRMLGAKARRGMASAAEAAQYDALRTNLLKNQLGMVNALITDLNQRAKRQSSVPPKDYSPDELRRRIAALEAERRYLERVLQGSRTRVRAQRRDTTPVAQRRTTVLCWQDMDALLFCIDEISLTDVFMRGHWSARLAWVTDRFDEAAAYSALALLDRLAASLEVPRNTIVACANGKSVALDTQGPDITNHVAFAGTAPNLPSIPEMAGMVAMCNFFAFQGGTRGAPGSGGGLGGGDQSWVRSTVAEIDKQIDMCGGDQTVMQGSAADIIGKMLGLPGKGSVYKAIATTPHAPDDWKEERAGAWQYEAVKSRFEANDLKERAKQAQNEAGRAEEVARELEERAANAPNDPDAQDEAVAARAHADEKKREADEAQKRAEDAEKRAKQAEVEADKMAKDAGSAKSGGGYGELGPSGATCGNLKAQWEFFKEVCDLNNGWERPGTACNLLLRRQRKCMDADPRVTNPNPDGTAPDHCTAASLSDQEKIKMACEWRQRFASAAEGFQSRCDPGLAEFAWPPPGDVCNDPAARPAEGQCAGGEFPILLRRPPSLVVGPQPLPSFAFLGAAQVIDGLGLNGTGLGPGPP